MNGLSICSGCAGIELGLSLVEPLYRTICYVEREAYAAAVLAARMEEGSLAKALIWSDVRNFDGQPWSGLVDVVTSGYPCQPFSVAGKRKGTADERWIWPDIWRVICEVRPQYIFLENVPAHVAQGFDRVLGDLAEGGYNAEWDLFSAAGVGAPHIRKRLFVLAYARSERRQPLSRSTLGHESENEGRAEKGNNKACSNGEGNYKRNVANPSMLQRATKRGSQSKRVLQEVLADAKSQGCPFSRPIRKQKTFADARASGQSEWWAVESDVGRVAHGIPNRVDRLRALGNAVVPLVAAKAWCVLMGRAYEKLELPLEVR